MQCPRENRVASKSSNIHKAYLPGMTADVAGGGEITLPLEVLARRLNRSPEDVIRLDSDENPYGCSLRVMEALGSAESLHRPGDPEARDLRAALEPYALCARDRIAMGAGPAESLERLLRVLTRPGQAIAVPAPTRPLYAAVAERVGREVVEIPLTRGFDVDTASLIAAAQTGQIALIIVGAPNDPTGTGVTAT